MATQAGSDEFKHSVPGLVSFVIFMLSQVYYIIFFLSVMVQKYSGTMDLESFIGMMKNLGTYGTLLGSLGITVGALGFLPNQKGKKKFFAYLGIGANAVVLVVSLLFALAAGAGPST